MSSTSAAAAASSFLKAITSRRSIYALGKDSAELVSNDEVRRLVTEAVRQSPTSFNSQSSRVVVLFGKDHDEYWNKTVHDALKVVSPPDAFEKGAQRLQGFAAASGTVLFFEDQTTIRGLQNKMAIYADRFPQWSAHSTGMAQANVWTSLELAGLGANLQHYGNLTQDSLIAKYGLPESWTLHAELVFGRPLKPAGDKSFMDDAERFRFFGDADDA